MAFFFGDGFDLYAAPANAIVGYWDGGNADASIVTGRFSGSRAFQVGNLGSTTTAMLLKNSGSNDAIHHLNFSIYATQALSGTNIYTWFTLLDGGSAQCSIYFRTDGAILLTSGNAGGTVLATYTGAITAINVWFTFEIELVINNTAGSITIRKNGNPANDFSATGLNTRAGTANNYANRLTVGSGTSGSNHYIDDLLWRSDAVTVPWVGDIRCYTRMPASDASVQWAKGGARVFIPFSNVGQYGLGANEARFTPITPIFNGTIGTVTVNFAVASTANFKCSIYANSAGAPTTPLGSATPISAPAIGLATFTFTTPVSVTAGTTYWIAFVGDAASGQYRTGSGATVGRLGTITYSAFPTSSPGGLTQAIPGIVTYTLTTSENYTLVNEDQQDAATSYVFSSTVGQSDLYSIASAVGMPLGATVLGVTTRGFFQKSDAGTRTVKVQLKSGSTTVQSADGVLTTAWGWVAKTDVVDPATGVAWTLSGVDGAQIGAQVTA